MPAATPHSDDAVVAGSGGESPTERGKQRARYEMCEGKHVPISGGGDEWYYIQERGKSNPGWIAIDPDDTVPIES